MRRDWNRRIGHDFLSWMNDRVQSEEALWETGRRDLEILLEGLDKETLHNLVALDLGCGVGRIAKWSAKHFKKVIGIDISDDALEKAKLLLSDATNISLIQGNGLDISQIEGESIDFAYSVGVLCNVPVIVCARYITELSRVLRPNGLARLQLFIGSCQPTVEDDTVAFRSFENEKLVHALTASGFKVEQIYEWKVDVEVPEDGWLKPVVFSIQKISPCTISDVELEQLLIPGGEPPADSAWPGSYVEYLLSTLRAEELAKSGKHEEALKAINYAISNYKTPDPKLVAYAKANKGS